MEGKSIPGAFNGSYYGKEVLLRGPWHTGRLSGYAEVSYVETPSNVRGKRRRQRINGVLKTPEWWRLGGIGGLFITDDLLARALARFQPHLRAAMVTRNVRTALEPVREDWQSPKGMKPEQEIR